MLDWSNLSLRQRLACSTLLAFVVVFVIVIALTRRATITGIFDVTAIAAFLLSFALNPAWVRAPLRAQVPAAMPRLCKALKLFALVAFILSALLKVAGVA
jgi:hypothetical protein